MDKDSDSDLNSYGNQIKKQIIKNFIEILKEKSLSGSYKNYSNDFKMDKFYEKLLSKKDRNFIINKSILALNNLNNKKRVNELRPNLIFKKIKIN